jgi:hypothetical protein
MEKTTASMTLVSTTTTDPSVAVAVRFDVREAVVVAVDVASEVSVTRLVDVRTPRDEPVEELLCDAEALALAVRVVVKEKDRVF